MKTVFRLLYQPYKWIVVLPTVVLSTLFFALLTIAVVHVAGPRAASIAAMIWARVNSYITPIFITVEGKHHLDPRTSYVVMSNHQSHYDILVVYGWLSRHIKWVMKKELRKIPVFGMACEKIGHIYIDRSNTEAAIRSIQEAKSRIEPGTSVIFFPEGTRSRDGRLRPFKKGGFKMAMDLGIPILPVTIIGTRDILPPDSLNIFPGRVRMIVHPPIDVSAYQPADLKALVNATRDIIDPARHLSTAAASDAV